MNILLCRCLHNIAFDKNKIEKIFNMISSIKNTKVYDIDDLCGLSVNNENKLNEILNNKIDIIFACYSRTIKNILSNTNINFKNIKMINIFKNSILEIEKELNDFPVNKGEAEITKLNSINNWIPWFPVIDYSRCTNCKQCLNFCLFGVYSLSNDGKVNVTQPKNCKTNCPACARICPSVAIIFPKHNEAPINGDEITDEDYEKTRVGIDMKKILGDDPYKALLDRRLKGKSNKLLKDD